MTISRRTLLAAPMALAMAAVLPTSAFASYCGNKPAIMLAMLSKIDAQVPDLVLSEARRDFDAAFADFQFLHQTALTGSDQTPAYHLRSDAVRQAFLDELFASSRRLLAAMKRLRADYAAAGVSGVPLDLLDLQISSYDGDYDVRRPQMAEAVRLLDDPVVAHDAVAREAAVDLREAIRTVGNGDAAKAVERAWASSPHITRTHFLHFLPVVSPAGVLVQRVAQLRAGAPLMV